MITQLNITGYKVVREARCDSLPNVMLICGPNGVGKTTILDAIGRRHGITEDKPTLISVAPSTRTWRKEAVQSRWLHGNTVATSDVYNLASPISTYGGQFNRSMYSGVRDLWSDDDAKQLVKPLLAKLETLWTQNITREIKEAHFITQQRTWANPKKVLSAFTEEIFDQLRYVDTSEALDQTTRVLFESINRPGEPPIDIDDLSSGEKAVFSVFLPVIEEEFRRELGNERREITVVVDEIEEHLHPSLQLRVLEYMRKKATDGYQFICTTHSTVLIKASAQKELFHVLPKGTTVGNQLRRAAEETYALVEVMQEVVLFASGYQRHIFCEGFDATKPDEKNVSDSELLTTLLDLRNTEKIVAAGSKTALEVGLKAAKQAIFAPLSLVGIVDGDASGDQPSFTTWCHLILPVYSIESILLDESAITTVLARYGKTRNTVRQAIEAAVLRVVAEREEYLIKPDACLRLKPGMQLDEAITHLRNGSIADIFDVLPSAAASLQAEKQRIDAARGDHKVAVKTLKGKKIYHYLYETLNLRGLSFTHRAFADQVMQQVRASGQIPWLNDFEVIAKRGIGNALSNLLLTDVGDPIRAHSVHTATIQRVVDMIEMRKLGNTTYGVLKDCIRMEMFAQEL